MQALILAAGGGSRLGEGANGMPKCLLDVGGKALVEHQLAMLSEAGVGPVAMVVGYEEQAVRERIGQSVEYIHNPEWRTTNSLYSFWLARDWIKGPVLVLNCDILVHPEILDRLLAAPDDAVVFDSASGDGRENMKVKVVDGRVRDMSKQLPREETAGENVGILRFSEKTARAMLDLAGKKVAADGRKKWVGTAVREVARAGDLRAVDIAGLPWAEIDFAHDLERARREVWPAIRRSQWRRRPGVRFARVFLVLAAVLLFAFGSYRGWFSPAPPDWEPVPLREAPAATLLSGGIAQSWHLLDGRTRATVELRGPRTVRIESRVLLPDPPAEKTPYVLEVRVDGERAEWFAATVKASTKATFEGAPVGKRERLVLELEDAALHAIEIRQLVSDSGRVLVRVRVPDGGESE